MENKLIYGIQQMGIGVPDAEKAFEWYATHLGADIKVFEDDNEATYMAPYMGGKPHMKKAILALNLEGGSGYELWQYTDREPQGPQKPIQLGDLGIGVAMIKSKNIQKTYNRLKSAGVTIVSPVREEPDGNKSFHIKDCFGNLLRIKESSSWYGKNNQVDIGGIFGSQLGVSDIDAALPLYAQVLGYDEIVYDQTGSFSDFEGLANGSGQFRRVLLRPSQARVGGFTALFGDSQLELIQALDYTPNKIFDNRFWGDLGYIHLCFDIRHMKSLTEECAAAGFPFTVLSNEDFDMGDANGHWGYLEDADGTLIEFVETHKVPVVKKLGLNINLKHRDPKKPLPNWMIKGMGLKRVKFK